MDWLNTLIRQDQKVFKGASAVIGVIVGYGVNRVAKRMGFKSNAVTDIVRASAVAVTTVALSEVAVKQANNELRGRGSL